MNRLVAIVAAVMTGGVLFLAMQKQGLSRVDAGGMTLRMLVAGSGSPAVVFDSGGGGWLELWGKVPARVAEFTAAVSYDRAGNGLSPPSPSPRDAETIARELRTLLRNAKILPPYVLVGHSLGGPHIRVFADLYPEDVAGMVLVDPTQEELFDWDDENGIAADRLPCTPVDGERSCIAESLAQANRSVTPPGIPVVLIHVKWPWPHGPFEVRELDDAIKAYTPRLPARLKFHRDWVERVPEGRFIETEKSSHGLINIEEPELVIDAIREVVAKARK